jgi:hypothetical protein
VVPVDVYLAGEPERLFTAVSRDLSATGMFVVTKSTLAVGASVVLELELPGEDGLAVARQRVDAKVVRHTPGMGYGLEFVAPPAALIAVIERLRAPR